MEKCASVRVFDKGHRPLGPDLPLQALLQMLDNGGQASVQNQICVSCRQESFVLIAYSHLPYHTGAATLATHSSFTVCSVALLWLSEVCYLASIPAIATLQAGLTPVEHLNPILDSL